MKEETVLPSAVLPDLTGLTPAQFQALLRDFDARWQTRHADRTVSGERRVRKRGGGHPPVLESVREKLVFILFYAKFYPSQDAMALIFGLSQGQVSHWLTRLIPVAVATLKRELILPMRRPASLGQLFHEVPQLLTVIKQRQDREAKATTQPLPTGRQVAAHPL